MDSEFPQALPGIYRALTVEYKVQNKPAKLTLEVQKPSWREWVNLHV